MATKTPEEQIKELKAKLKKRDEDLKAQKDTIKELREQLKSSENSIEIDNAYTKAFLAQIKPKMAEFNEDFKIIAIGKKQPILKGVHVHSAMTDKKELVHCILHEDVKIDDKFVYIKNTDEILKGLAMAVSTPKQLTFTFTGKKNLSNDPLVLVN